MNARAQQLQEAAGAWLAANKHWARGCQKPDSLAPRHRITPEAADGRELLDLRRAVPVPAADRRGLPVLASSPPRDRQDDGRYAPYASCAPARLPHPGDLAEDDGDARRAIVRAAIMSRYTGTYGDVLDLLLHGRDLHAIADEVGLTWHRVRQIVRGNSQRPDEGSLVAWLESIAGDLDMEALVALVQPAPVTVQPVHTLKKRYQKQAVLGQLAWDFESMGVAA
ncbi:hypothetical protein BBC27_14845 [Acidithiobacillus ferrivorans]|uniref:Uncharacterized protein n=1 Tax=Acidithiobacillus ferrivorans TaxID=160808 RepID=A0A1B9BWF5_9PROT|nr:hypothetical protein [Acidithiobacillus ferrivorans]OCB02037.1 hypothetical protein BBC27_14845 [Acidithiobacillus ferrivorans]